jgi:hypothetical protein
MSALSIQPTYPIFTETNGLPLENGYIWIGTANLDPQGNPIDVYWDAALTQPAGQPIRTINGYPSNNGTPARLYVNSDYSIRVQNSKGSLVYSAPAATERYSEVVLTGLVTASDLSNTSDIAKGDALVGYRQSYGNALITGSVGKSLHKKMQEFLSVYDFMTEAEIIACQTNTGLDVTTAVQTALDYAEDTRNSHLTFPAGVYTVSQITLGRTGNRNNGIYNFYGAIIAGNSGSYKSSVVQIKAGFMTIYGLSVTANLNQNYECAVHWFTNDVAVYYPGFVKIEDMIIGDSLMGLCIGALPSQATIPPYYPPASLPDGEAVNAPVSESAVTNLRIKDCIVPVYMRQPNGKLQFVGPVLDASNAAWSSTPATASGNVKGLVIIEGELSILGGEVLNISSQDGALVDIVDGTLNLIGVGLESQCPMYMSPGRATLRISGDTNWGLNNDSTNFFRVFPTQDGELVVTDSFLRRGYGTSSGQAVVRGVSDVTGSYAVNSNMFVNFTNVEFGDSNFQGSTSSYLPLIKGVRSVIKNCRLVKTSLSTGYPRVYDYKVDEKTNLLAGIADLSNTVITAYGVNGNATSGGWTFATPGGSPNWGSYTTGLPTIQSYSVSAALRMNATGSGVSLTGTSAKFAVEPQRPYLLKGWIKTGTSAAALKLMVNYYNFSNTASSIDAQYEIFNGAESEFASTWQPFIAWFVPPADTTKAELVLYVENNADLQIFNLQIM